MTVMKRTLMLSLALGFALFAAGCSGAVDEPRPVTDEQASGLEGDDPGAPGSDEGAPTTTSGIPGDPGQVEGPTPDPWKSPVTIEGTTPNPGPSPDPDSQTNTNTNGSN